MTDENEIYEKFIKYLGKTWWGLPESKELVPIIKERYTVEDADFLTRISLPNGTGPLFGKTAEKIAKKNKLPASGLRAVSKISGVVLIGKDE